MSDVTTGAPPMSSRWDTNAPFWVQIIRERRDKYRNELTDPAMLRAIGEPDGLTVLDAGCGEGYFSRMLAKEGATVTGIDSSASLIVAAQAQSHDDALEASFDVGSVDSLPYDDDAFDLIVCNHVLNDLRNPTAAISEFGRVLHPGGRLVNLMLHPCFYNKHVERDQTTNGLLASAYFDLRSIEQTFKVDGLTSPAANVAWFRPLEFYTEALRNSDFIITGLTEPHPSSAQVTSDPWWQKGFSRPLFMLITAEQLKSTEKRNSVLGMP